MCVCVRTYTFTQTVTQTMTQTDRQIHIDMQAHTHIHTDHNMWQFYITHNYDPHRVLKFLININNPTHDQ